jgi:hypothetical protein
MITMGEIEYSQYRNYNLNKCDQIDIDYDTFKKIQEITAPIWENNDSLPINPFLNEGIIHIEAEFYGARGKFSLYFKVVDDGIYYKLLDRPLDFFHNNEGSVSIDCEEISQTEYFKTLSDEEAIHAINETVVHCIKSFSYSMFYIEQVRENPKIVEVQKERKVTMKKPKGGKGKNRRIVINKTIYKVTYDEEMKDYNNRTFQRHVDSWTVSGHHRHYKNGKVIFINPYIKGHGEKSSKTYVVKDY